MGDIRIGKVSSVDYNNGMAQVLYTDHDGAVTKALPIMTFNDEYKMPKVGSYVLVAHLSNGSEAGYILGNYWNMAHKSASTGKGVYRKEYSSAQGQAYTEYKDESKTLEIHADNILFDYSDGKITVEEIINTLANVGKRLKDVEGRG